MECTELGLYSFNELKVIWSKTYTDEVIKEKLQAEAERRCREVVEELDSTMRRYLIGDEGTLEDLVESVLSIIYDEDPGIDLDNPQEILGQVIGWDDITGLYLYVVKDREGQEYIGGKVNICVEFEDTIDEEDYEAGGLELQEVRITDVSVTYETITRL